MLSKLAMVNSCLSAIGNEPVIDLEWPDSDTDIIVQIVDQQSMSLLSAGWWFNTELQVPFNADEKGRVPIPKTIIDFKATGCNRGAVLVKRSELLYDTRGHTFNLTPLLSEGKIYLDVVIHLAIDDLPLSAQQLLQQKSRSQTIFDLTGDLDKAKLSMKQEIYYLGILESQHIENSRSNIYDNPFMSSILGELFGLGSINPVGGGAFQ